MDLAADDYFRGALQRLGDAQRLYDARRWVASIYLAGRAVESLLRALIWVRQQQADVGHDLPQLFRRAGSIGLLESREEQPMLDRIFVIASVWRNSLRYCDDQAYLRLLKSTRRDRRISRQAVKGDPFKANALSILEAADAIVARGKLIWMSRSKQN